jgi:hypothetical protein
MINEADAHQDPPTDAGVKWANPVFIDFSFRTAVTSVCPLSPLADGGASTAASQIVFGTVLRGSFPAHTSNCSVERPSQAGIAGAIKCRFVGLMTSKTFRFYCQATQDNLRKIDSSFTPPNQSVRSCSLNV